MEENGTLLAPAKTNATSGIKVLVLQINRQHLFVHDVTNESVLANAIRRCSDVYRRKKRFANSHFRFDVLEVTAPPAREEMA